MPRITRAGFAALKDDVEIAMLAPRLARGGNTGAGSTGAQTESTVTQSAFTNRGRGIPPPLDSPADRARFESLREICREISRNLAVPAYMVFEDSTLREMVRLRPTTAHELLEVRGVGEKKLERFGAQFLAALWAAGRV